MTVQQIPKSRRVGGDTPVCACGHDIFYHDIAIIGTADEGEPTPVKVGRCHGDECKCRRYYGTNEWFNDLWNKFKRYQK